MLEVNTKAPDFTLSDKDGSPVSLSNFKGKKIVLYFYPKDNTPGCTRQACAFAKSYQAFQSMDTVVIGISKDSTASHQKFADKYELPFILLSDPELKAICLLYTSKYLHSGNLADTSLQQHSNSVSGAVGRFPPKNTGG